MPETVTIPGGAKVNKKVAITVEVLAVGVAGYYLYRSKQAKAASATDTTSSNTDPQTGFQYGSPEDQAALAQLSGGTLGQLNSGSFVGGSVIGYDQFGNPIYTQGQGGGITGTGGFTSNAQWTQAAESLMGSTGADAIAAALGKYLLGQEMTEEQVTIVQQAIAAEGFPPIPGPNGFPPSYKTAQPPSGGGGGGTGGAKNPVTGIHASPRSTQVDVSWTALTGATSYLVKALSGSHTVSQMTVIGTSATLHDLKPHTSYKITVWGKPGSGATGSTTTRTK